MKSKFTIVSYEPSENRDKIKAKYPDLKVETLKDIKEHVYRDKVAICVHAVLLLLSVAFVVTSIGDRSFLSTLLGGFFTLLSLGGVVDSAVSMAENLQAEKQLEE